MMNPKVIKTNVKSFKVLSDDKVPFGRKIDTMHALKAWKQSGETRSAWISQKRRSLAAALREFRDLYQAKEYYAEFGKNDDTFEIFYRV